MIVMLSFSLDYRKISMIVMLSFALFFLLLNQPFDVIIYITIVILSFAYYNRLIRIAMLSLRLNLRKFRMAMLSLSLEFR